MKKPAKAKKEREMKKKSFFLFGIWTAEAIHMLRGLNVDVDFGKKAAQQYGKGKGRRVSKARKNY